MTLVSGPLSTVTTTPSAVSQVNISINSPRTQGTGVMTPEVKTVAVTGGDFSSQIAPGPAVLTLLIGGRESAPIPILVDDIPSQTLANAVNAAKVATPDNKEWLEKLAAEVIAGTQGPKGDPGIAPHVQGETWWVGGIDTGIRAQGPRGEPGPAGPTGPTGTLDLIDESAQTTIDTVVVPAIEGARDEALGQVEGAVEAATNNFARVIPSRNLYNPDWDTLDAYIANGNLFTYAGYRTSDYIPVTPGQYYTTVSARHVNFYDSARVYITGSWSQPSPVQPSTVLAPAGAAYMRVSYSTANISPIAQQIEKGTTSTPHVPYQRVLDPEIVVQTAPATSGGPVRVSRSGDVVTVTSDLGGQPITQEVTLGRGRNSVMNFSRTQYGDIVQTFSDDIAPIRTTQGTVGANHGLVTVSRWPAGSHDKTLADVGSVWTDGTTEHVILHIDSAGHIYIGRAYTTNANGAVVSHSVAPAADLTHVSGATHTTPIPRASRVSDQLTPWVQRRRVVVEMDGRTVTDGTTSGRALTIRESYEILDYGAVYDWAKANVGQSYTAAHHRAAVGVETEWAFHPGGKTRHRTRLWEVSPTRLGSCGFLQAITLPGEVTRYIPGVGVVGGLDWHAGVDLEQLTTSLNVKSTDLLDPRLPPTVVVDERSDMALAVAVSPWHGASQSAQRLASTPSSLWDLRSTKKIYPVVLNDVQPGWGHIEVEGIRAYLTPDEATAIVADADPISAWVTLDQMSG